MPSIPRSLARRAGGGGGSALGRIAVLAAANIPHLHPRPALDAVLGKPEENPGSGSFWMNVGIAVALVALGGIFAGLTLGYVCPVS